MIGNDIVIIILGLAVQLGAIVHFFNRLEHRLTKVETNLMHVMRRSGMTVRESELEQEI